MTDRELDAMVAEKVMGWFRVENAEINRRNTGPCWWHTSKGDPLDPVAGASAGGLPLFSSDIAAAWTVVEEMRRRGQFLALDVSPSVFYAYFSDGAARKVRGPDTSDRSAPRAICLAALKALGIDHGGSR